MAKVDFCFGLCWQVAESLSNKSTNDKALVILTYFVVVLCHSLVILSETKYPFCHTCLALPTYFCHTERSEVSKNGKFSLICVNFRPFHSLKMTKCAVIASFNKIIAWQTIKFRLSSKFVILSFRKKAKYPFAKPFFA